LITGSSRGLGRQIAVKLATEGVKKIAVHYRTGKSDAEETLSLIEAAGASGVLVQGDVADPKAAESLVNEAVQKLGGWGSTPITRTLQKSLIMGQEECHGKAKEVQRRVQA
jgi:NAD(P)-dependent dehydrogenase (short-subunit alcohol dehydrogenase family)